MYKKKVIMVGPIDVQGGMSTVIQNYKKSKKLKECVDVFYISSATDGSKFNKLNIMLKSILKFISLLIFNKIDLVHIHMALDGSIYRKGIFIKLSKLFRKKVILHFHASDLSDFYYNRCSKFKQKIVRDIFGSADVVIALNKPMQKLLKDLIGVNSLVLYNFINNESKNIYDLKSKNILMISRLTKDKGVYEAINIMKDLRKYGLKLVLAGDSDEIEIVRKYVHQNCLDRYIDFVGWVDECKKELLFKDCFVSILPSHFEGIPMSILESLSYGVPVIASNVGGIPEIISPREGYLHEKEDENELKCAILDLYNSENQKLKLSKNCILTFEKNFKEEKHIKELVKIYMEII